MIATEINELFNRPRHVWVMEYGVSHSMMRLAIHDGDYPRCTELMCQGCTYFSGPLQGGPYAIQIGRSADGTGWRIAGGDFVLECLDLRIHRVRT